ncbi:MAG TPA: Ldh family oxidoreductase, partial [Burkholderiales bacterium]
MARIFQQQPLTRAIEAIAVAGGSAPREAQLVAENLVMANLVGHDSHGIGMMPRYVE